MGGVSEIEIFSFIFFSCLLSLGGGNGQIPIIQGQWVATGVLSPNLFSFALAISYLTPGPKAGFIAGIGYYLGGISGALAAVLGLVIPTCFAASATGYAIHKLQKLVVLVKPSASFIIASLILAAAWGTASEMKIGLLEVVWIIIVALLLVFNDIDPIWLVLGSIFI